MFKKKYIVIAVGILSILLGSLFVNNVILAQSSGEYDPWIDNNEDGIIDVNDLASMSQSYGSSGDPTKNVNVTNFPEPIEPKTIIVCQNYTLTWPGSGNVVTIASFDMVKYQYVTMFVAYYKTSTYEVALHLDPSCQNITKFGCDIGMDIDLRADSEWRTEISTNKVNAPNLILTAAIYDGSIELTIVLYCYN